MVPTSKCLDVGDHICAVVYTTSYVRQILVGAVYYTARTYIGHDDRSSAQLWRSLSYIRGGITEIGYFASWGTKLIGGGGRGGVQKSFSRKLPKNVKNSSNEQNIVQISKMDNLWIHLNYILAYPIDSFEEFSVSILFLAHLNFSVN